VADIDGSYWSLFVEMKFYGLVAVVLLLGYIRHARLLLVLWLFASIALEIVHVGRLRSLLIVDYSAFFIAGAACFLVWSEGISSTRIGVIAASWCLAVWQSVRALHTVEEHYHTQMSGYVVAGAVTAFFAVMFRIAARRTGALSRRRWAVAGAMTYPLYLLHQNIGFAVFNAAYPSINRHVLPATA
jgi:peptidoglycan/LPS O-acetylase OafA/YrhL